MAKQLRLRRGQYLQGSLNLYRGDAWSVLGDVVERVGNVLTPADLTGLSLTGWFPGAVTGAVEVTDALGGAIKIALSEEQTPLAPVTTIGTSMYLTALGDDGLTTIVTDDAPLVIQDRGFISF